MWLSVWRNSQAGGGKESHEMGRAWVERVREQGAGGKGAARKAGDEHEGAQATGCYGRGRGQAA